jgi:hypothetical protein
MADALTSLCSHALLTVSRSNAFANEPFRPPRHLLCLFTLTGVLQDNVSAISATNDTKWLAKAPEPGELSQQKLSQLNYPGEYYISDRVLAWL